MEGTRASLRLALAAVLAVCAAAAAAMDETRSVGGVDFSSIVSLDVDDSRPGKIVAILRNDGARTIRGVVILVKHSWVWPESSRVESDSYSHTEYVNIDEPLLPGQRRAFASVHTPLRAALDEARFFSDVKVMELTEIRYASDPPR